MAETATQDRLIDLTAEIVAAHVSNSQVESGQIAPLVGEVYAALKAAVEGSSTPAAAPEPEKPTGKVTARKSLSNPDHILSMLDGKPYKTLKRHLSTNGYTPESYREAFGLPRDYPMTAPNYSAARAAMAKKIGLGAKPGQRRGGRRKAATK